MVAAIFPSSVFASSTASLTNGQYDKYNTRHSNNMSDKKMLHQETIDTLNNYVLVKSDGTMYFNIPQDVYNKLGDEQIKLAQKCLDATNNSILNGKLVATANGTLYASNDRNGYLQEAPSGVEYYWWGISTTWTQSEAAQLESTLYNMSLGASAGTVAFGVAGIAVPFLEGVAIGCGLGSAYYSTIASQIGIYNNPKGIRLDISYTGSFSVYAQP